MLTLVGRALRHIKTLRIMIRDLRDLPSALGMLIEVDDIHQDLVTLEKKLEELE